MTLKMLIVDDEESIRWALRELFMQDGWEVHCARDGTEAVDRIDETTYDFIITDLKMPGCSGVDVVRRGRQSNPAMGVMVLTGYATLDTAIEALRLQAWDYVTKPCDVRFLKRRIGEFFKHKEAHPDATRPRKRMDQAGLQSFLDGGGTELIGPVPARADQRAAETLGVVHRMLVDLGFDPGRADELVQPCVEAIGRLGVEQGGAHLRGGVFNGYAVVAISGSLGLDETTREAIDRVNAKFQTDARVMQEDGLCSVVLCEGI
jgi:CheY-like chemotaxis protein